jgi:hypothetical protein
MPLFSLLSLYDDTLRAPQAKVHLATRSGDDPLVEFTQGRFESWQARQNKKNFQRPLVVSLIQFRRRDQWLFAGVYDVRGVSKQQNHFSYDLVERSSCTELKGRVVVWFDRSFRQSYLNAETYADQLRVQEVLGEAYRFEPFPGYRRVHLSKAALDAIVQSQPLDWKTALASVGGVYVLSDQKTGRLYVGSAAGAGGIWQRWCEYSTSGGHAGNMALRELIGEEGVARSSDFSFAILEIADVSDAAEDVLEREGHWKRVLGSRAHGFNEN